MGLRSEAERSEGKGELRMSHSKARSNHTTSRREHNKESSQRQRQLRVVSLEIDRVVVGLMLRAMSS